MKKTLALVAAAQLALVAVGVAPQLSARVTGDEYQLLVQPVDPIDPFRGAYVTLDYPGLQAPADSEPASMDDGESGDLYVTLVPDGDLWVSGDYTRSRPEDGPYLACDDRDWAIRCGIESWFVPQDEALALEQALAEDGAIATIKVDSRGHAAIVALAPR
jgi:uncharacterized membrane-anchored protein